MIKNAGFIIGDKTGFEAPLVLYLSCEENTNLQLYFNNNEQLKSLSELLAAQYLKNKKMGV